MTADILSRRNARGAALTVYALYLLSIPSLAVFAPLGVILAYATRGDADPLARAHLDAQVRLFWIAFVWGAALLVASAVSWGLTLVLIGFPLLWLLGLAGLAVMLWFTVKSAMGLYRLAMSQRP